MSVLLVSFCSVLFTGKAGASGSPPQSFTYTNNSWSGITAATDNGTQNYTKSTGGNGIYTGGGAVGYSGCSAFLQTNDHKYDGDTKGRWYTVCGNSNDNTSTTINISKPVNYVGTWIDHSHLKVFDLSNPSDSDVYYDGKIDNGNQYTAQNPPGGCSGNVVQNFNTGGDPSNAAGAGKATVSISHPVSSVNTNCSNPATFKIVQFQETQDYADYFVWVDSGNIETSDDGKTMAFASSSGSTFVDNGGSSCKSQITPDSGDPSQGTLIIRHSGSSSDPNSSSNPYNQGFSPQFYQSGLFSNHSGCEVSKPLHVNIGRPENAKKASGTGTIDGAGPGGAGAGGAGSDQLGCDASSNPLSWIICPVINDLLVPGISATDTLITQQMVVPSQNIFCSNSSSCDDYYTAWSSFRNLSLGLLAAAGMVVIVSQAIGMEILDAYTIRKVLPRILIAAIAITLSWQLMQFAVTLSNNLGFGIRDLLTAPFNNLNSPIDLSFSSSSVVNLFSGFTLLAVGVIASFVAGLGLLLSYLATAGLAVLVAITVLVLRQIVIIMLIILSPVALIAYVLPNTQRAFHLWWESFSKALLMFPLIAAFIAAGRVFAAISLTNVGSNPSPISELIGFVAYFAPYFMIPLTFRMSGAALSGMGNMVAQRGQALQGRLGKYRGEQWKSRNEQFRAGTLAEGKKWIPGSITAAKALNRTGSGLGVGWKGRYGVGKRGKEALGQHKLAVAGDLAKDPRMAAILGYNDANRILAEGAGDERLGRQRLFDHLTKDGGDDGKTFLSPEVAQAKVDKAAKAAKAAGGFTEAHGLVALRNMARDGTAIRDTDDLARLAAVAGHGDRNATFTTAAELASTSRQAGRPDLAAASEPIGKLAFAYSDTMHNGSLYKGEYGSEGDLSALSYEAWESGAGGESAYGVLNSGKSRAIRFPTEYAMKVVKNEEGTYNDEQRQHAASFLMHTQQGVNSGYGRPNNIAAFRQIVGDPENARALESFLSQPATVQEPAHTMSIADRQPQVETRTVQGTQRDIVGKLVSERMSMSEEQRAEMASRGAQEQDQEEQQ